MSAESASAKLYVERDHRYVHHYTVSLITKRVFDIVIATLGLVVAAPLFAVIAIAIKRDSPGPVFFKQVRVGKKRRLFSMWKFRKMPHELSEQGPMLTARDDGRLTRVGYWLERTKLDELPQLLNVLASEMSVVGPRPEVTKFVDRATPEFWDQALSVKPGIFGANQIRYRNEADLYPKDCEDLEAYYLRHILPAKLEVVAEYAQRCNVLRDVGLLVRGVGATLLCRPAGARGEQEGR
jgi:lipopolysaccharide/colanic/teichoic acid biosynthesis glycosyltransferase